MDYTRTSGGVIAPADRRARGQLMEEVRRKLRVKHYSLRTEQAYTGWIRRFILDSGRR